MLTDECSRHNQPKHYINTSGSTPGQLLQAPANDPTRTAQVPYRNTMTAPPSRAINAWASTIPSNSLRSNQTLATNLESHSLSHSRRVITDVLAPLNELARNSTKLIAAEGGKFETGEGTLELPRYLFIGPKGGADTIRLGLFAGIHGDEPEGVYALIRFAHLLEAQPELATGYCLFIYPICNPTGFEDRTRHSRAGKDLNREFWRSSPEPEARLLQSELVAHAFDGIISLHTDDTSHGFYGFAHGATLTRHLIEPALDAAAEFVPRNGNEVIDGFPARDGIVRKRYPGVLSAPPKVRPRPFELVLETPSAPPNFFKEAALVAALRTILLRYRELMAYAPNL